jgi:hypothetical protein
MVMPFLHTGRKRAPLLPETEEPMTTIDFIQIPPDFVVKFQPIDITELILR